MSVILPQSLQQGIQESLPVIPNNGNPGGANNMPAGAEQQAAAPPDPYAWLKPSPYMDQVTQLLQDDSTIKYMLQDMVDPPEPGELRYSVIEDIMSMTQNPTESNKSNLVVRNGSFGLMPLNDSAIPLGSNAPTRRMPSDYEGHIQYSPILPGE